LLDRDQSMNPDGFEQLVMDIMIGMGYGGGLAEHGTLTSHGADGGIDGIINEDPLGLETIYLQAKRWENPVGRPEIQKFVGALQGMRARKGVFMTTGSFSPHATEYANAIDPRVILIDGDRLARLMIRHEIGVTPVETYKVRRVDSDYFVEE